MALRDSTRPGFRSRYSRSAYSRAVSESVRGPRRAVRAAEVELQRVHAECHTERVGWPTRQRPQARHELRDGERLGQIIVGACIEPADSIGEGTPRAEHQHRSPPAVRPKAAADLPTVQVGQPEVEHDEIVLVHRESLEGRRRRAGRVSSPRGLAERPAEEVGKLRLVLDQEYAHPGS